MYKKNWQKLACFCHVVAKDFENQENAEESPFCYVKQKLFPYKSMIKLVNYSPLKNSWQLANEAQLLL